MAYAAVTSTYLQHEEHLQMNKAVPKLRYPSLEQYLTSTIQVSPTRHRPDH